MEMKKRMMNIHISQPKGLKHKKLTASDLLPWLPALLYLANIWFRMGHSSAPYLACLICAGSCGLIGMMKYSKVRRRGIISFMIVYFIMGLINCMIIRNIEIRDLANDALLFGVLFLMLLYPMNLCQGTIFYCVSMVPFVFTYFTGRAAKDILTSSGNFVSVLVIISTCIFYISVYNSRKEFLLIHLIPAALCFFLSVWARGRGGILGSTVLLALMVAYYLYVYIRRGGSLRAVLLWFVIILICGYLFIRNINLIESFMSLGKWSSKGTDNTDRIGLWRDYFSKAWESVVYLIGGAPFRQIPSIQAFGNNTHNSFLQLHATNGLPALGMFLFLLVRAICRQIKKKQLLLAILITALFVRGMTDKFIFGQYGMPVMLYLVFRWDFEKKERPVCSVEGL